MIAGLWTGVFKSNTSNISQGVGVFAFQKGRIQGGNQINYFLGDYEVSDDLVKGSFTSIHYAGDPIGIFGLIPKDDKTRIEFEAKITGETMTFVGRIPTMPTLRITGELTRRKGSEIF